MVQVTVNGKDVGTGRPGSIIVVVPPEAFASDAVGPLIARAESTWRDGTGTTTILLDPERKDQDDATVIAALVLYALTVADPSGAIEGLRRRGALRDDLEQEIYEHRERKQRESHESLVRGLIDGD